jgi:TolB-like protein/DNA-binding winged helix-turn-helix (wHTH) protein/Tfp pilus assembly protein PilF
MSAESKRVYEFGPFRIDTAERILLREGKPVSMTPKAFDVLTLLVERSGHIVEKEQLINRVWADSFVEEGNLKVTVSMLRKVLEDGAAGQQFIETVPRRGYRFVADVRELSNQLGDIILFEQTRAEVLIEEENTGQKLVSISARDAADSGPARFVSRPEQLLSQDKRRLRGRASLALAASVMAIAATAYYFYFARADRTEIRSIAVLPFTNSSGDPDAEYLSDGITESLINSLSKLSTLRVTARTTAFSFKGRSADPRQAGRQLNVDALLTGRVAKRGDTLSIQVDLIRVADGSQLWGEQYHRKLSDILAVQREIAKEISSNPRLKLSSAEQSRVTKHYTENPEAYQLYLKGRYFWNRFTPADHQRAAEYFRQAIGKDPTYALAYTGLGDTYGASAANSWIAPTEGYAEGKALAKRALELDETLAEAHVSFGAGTMFQDLDWAAAEREYQRAIELNPQYAIAYSAYSYLLCATGRVDEGIKTAKRGLEVDPLSVLLIGDTGQAYYLARRYDEALKQIEESFEIDPNDAGANIILGMVYEQKRMYDEAIAAYEKAINASERTSAILGLLGHACAASGRRVEALKRLDELKAMSRQKYVSPYDMAVLYTGLGEKDRAIEQLNKAFEERAGWIINLKVEPLFDPLRSDSRLADLVRRMGL